MTQPDIPAAIHRFYAHHVACRAMYIVVGTDNRLVLCGVIPDGLKEVGEFMGHKVYDGGQDNGNDSIWFCLPNIDPVLAYYEKIT